MKKLYALLAFFAIISLSAFAQVELPIVEETINDEILNEESESPADVIFKAEGDPKAPIYYKKPYGAYFMGISEKGYTMSTAALFVPPFVEVTFTARHNDDVNPKWKYVKPGTGATDYSTAEKLSLTYENTAPYLTSIPSLTGSGDNYSDSVFMNGQYMRVATPCYKTETAGRYGFGNNPYGPVYTYNSVVNATTYFTVNGTLQTYWESRIRSAYGTEKMTSVTTKALGEYFNKPLSPFTLTGLIVRGKSSAAINCDIKMTVRDSLTRHIIAYFILPQNEIQPLSNNSYRLVFNDMYDASGNPIDELVIDKPFYVFYEPLDETEFTISTHRTPNMNDHSIRILFDCTYQGSNRVNQIYSPKVNYSSGNCENACAIYLLGQFDWLKGDVTTYDAPAEGGDVAVTVNASAPYKPSGEDTPQWSVTLEDGTALPDWITVDGTDTFSSGTYQGTTTLTLTAAAQAEGAAARSAVVKIEWRGSTHIVTITQEEAPVTVVTLDEAVDNSEWLTENNGETRTVTLTRTFSNASYNTLSLPFAVDATTLTNTFGEGTHLMNFTGTSTDADDNIILNFEEVTAIDAGKPYLILPANTVANPTFTDVTISSATTSVSGTDADFMPNINATEYAASEQLMYLGANNTLYFNNTAATMKGFRAYWQLKNASSGKNFRFSYDGATTGIITIDNGQPTKEYENWYTVDGIRLNAAPTQKGVYIYNGKKVVIK